MPGEFVNIFASEVILNNPSSSVTPGGRALLSILAGLLPGWAGLVVPIVAAASSAGNTSGATKTKGVPIKVTHALVPDVLGHPREKAVERLQREGLRAAPKFVYSHGVPVDEVISQSPDAKNAVRLNSTVQLVVSAGPPPAGTKSARSNRPVSDSQLAEILERQAKESNEILERQGKESNEILERQGKESNEILEHLNAIAERQTKHSQTLEEHTTRITELLTHAPKVPK